MISKLIRRVLDFPAKIGRNRRKPKVIPVSTHGIRRGLLNQSAQTVISQLQSAGFSAYVVGGAVRDLLLGMTPKDYDIVTDATPEQVHQLFRRSRIIGRRFRIVHVIFSNETIEVTTFRGGDISEHSDNGRIMKDNNFGSREEDAYRRDFTVNALLYDPANESIVDYLQGIKDLKDRRLAMIGNPVERYKEDPVRMLRAVRLSAKLNLEIAPDTCLPIKDYSHLLKKEPGSRLFDELLKLLFCGNAYVCIKKMHEVGFDNGIFPLLDAAFDGQENDAFIQIALGITDERIRQGKSVSVGYLLASLLWPKINRHWQAQQNAGEKSAYALLLAIEEIDEWQSNRFSIPRRYSATMREIWGLQPRFELRVGQRPYRLLEQNRFSAGYDFLLLRAQNSEVTSSLTDWWRNFQDADEQERIELIIQAKQENDSSRTVPRKRKRRRKPKELATTSEESCE